MLPDNQVSGGLTIQSVRQVANFVPPRPCNDTLYGPYLFSEGSGADARQLLFVMGGHIDGVGDPWPWIPQQDQTLSDPGRFADKIYVCQRSGSGWSAPNLIVAKAFFPWMANGDAYLQANPQVFVGSVAGPNVIKIDSTYYMFFSGSVGDPNICTGEHAPPSNIFGSCLVPWSYFVIFSATSNDGLNWTLRNTGNPNPNVALQYASLYYTPSTADQASGSFKGLGMPHGVIFRGGHLYLFSEFWTSVGLRNVVFRSADLTTFDIWNGGGWDPCTGGSLPQWANQSIWTGNPYAHIINQVAPTTQLTGSQYILTAQGAGGSNLNNCIEYAGSNDLLSWSAAQIVSSTIPTVNGTGASNMVLNPIYYEDASGYHFLFATNDYNLDGQPDCNGPYPGLAIDQGDPTPAQQATRRRAAGGQTGTTAT